MTIAPTTRSAAIAGAWAAVGLVPYDAWQHAHTDADNFLKGVLFLLMAAVFFIGPFFFFVLGRESRSFTRTWFLDSEQRARYGIVARRMFVWFISAAVTGTVWGLLLFFVWPKSSAQ